MEVKVLSKEKESMEIELDSVTIAEIVKVYLNEDSAVSFAAWKKEHPTENPILKIVTKGKAPQKAISDAIKAIGKDLDSAVKDFKSMK